jgi:CRISPR-associated helicase Cas3
MTETVADLADSTFDLQGAWIPKSDEGGFFPIADGRPDTHQAETARQLRDDTIASVINANPTGSGKTLAWVAPTIRSQETDDPWIVIATYPTIALVGDQRETIKDHYARYFSSEEWSGHHPFELEERDGTRLLTDGSTEYQLDELVTELTSRTAAGVSNTQRAKAAERTALDAQADNIPAVILTTPDTLTLMATNRFSDPDIASLPSMCDHIVVDEFHLSNPRGKRLLPFHLDVFQRLSNYAISTLTFLSATPSPTYMDRLVDGLDATSVSRTVSTSASDSDEGRQVLPQTRLHVASKRIFSAGEWLADRAETIEEFYSPTGQTLVVADAVWEVDAVYEALVEATDLAIGRVYGWKREDHQRTIDTADIVVGNTAIEVGIDFERVDRVMFTGYDAGSVLQRIGRMRYRSALDDYRALLLTKPSVVTALQDSITTEAASVNTPSIDRSAFEAVVNEKLTDPVDPPYYDVLCGAYSRYLWVDEPERPLRSSYRQSDSDPYEEIVHDHFAQSMQTWADEPEPPDIEEFWELLGSIESTYYREGGYPVFEEMHSHRGSSLSCVILDRSDPGEPLKQYALHHVLRHRHAEIVSSDELKRRYDAEFGPLSDEDEDRIDDLRRTSCGCVVVTGQRESPRSVRLTDHKFGRMKAQKWNDDPRCCRPGSLIDPVIEIDPPLEGIDRLDLIGEDSEYDSRIITQYLGCSTRLARDRYNLGPYANLSPFREDECLAFWQDGIIAHSYLMSEHNSE